MKIRILDDTIRLRLERTEVDQVAAGEIVSAQTRFPGGARFSYELVPGGEIHYATFDGGTIRIAIEDKTSRKWAKDDTEVSIRAQIPIDDGELSLLIEKDFECLDPREGESQANRFANPKAG